MPLNSKNTCWNRRPWPWQYPPGYKWGIPTPAGKFYTAFDMGGARERMAISKGENVYPYWHTLNFSLAARDSQTSQIIPSPDEALLMFVATPFSSPQTFRTRLFQVVGKETGLRMDEAGVDDANRFGNGANPFYLRQPHYPPEYGSLQVRCGNLTNAAVTVQLAIVGLRPRYKDLP